MQGGGVVTTEAADKTGASAHRASPTRDSFSASWSKDEPSPRPERLLATLSYRGAPSHPARDAKRRL